MAIVDEDGFVPRDGSKDERDGAWDGYAEDFTREICSLGGCSGGGGGVDSDARFPI